MLLRGEDRVWLLGVFLFIGFGFQLIVHCPATLSSIAGCMSCFASRMRMRTCGHPTFSWLDSRGFSVQFVAFRSVVRFRQNNFFIRSQIEEIALRNHNWSFTLLCFFCLIRLFRTCFLREFGGRNESAEKFRTCDSDVEQASMLLQRLLVTGFDFIGKFIEKQVAAAIRTMEDTADMLV